MNPQRRALRVLPIPSAHAYPQRLRPRRVDGYARVAHLSDPPVPGAPPGTWWPPPALDPSWLARHADNVDVVHLHFGFDAATPAGLTRWCETLQHQRVALVLTVHDLVNPHFVDQDEHLARLDVLVPRADEVITLTDGAAREIRRRWQRDAAVLPHPHVTPLRLVGVPPRRPAHRFVVGLHLKGLRANVVAAPVVDALADAVDPLPSATLRVHLHREVLDPEHPRHDPALVTRLRSLQGQGRLELTVHEPHSDDELWDYLHSVDLSVLPYAFGTHSGWFEACRDLGTATLAPRTGFWTEQGPGLTFGWPSGGAPSHDEVTAAVRQAYDDRPTWQVTRPERERQQQQVAAAHERIYLACADELSRGVPA